MSKPKVIYYGVSEYQPESIQMMEDNFDLVRLNTPDEDTLELLSSVDGIIAPLKFLYDKEKIDSFSKLKIIGTACTGAPHVDVEYANSKGIKVMYLRHEKEFLKTITPTAEMSFALLFAVSRRIPWAFKAVCGGTWNRNDWPSQRMLSRMDLGIVGLGRLGIMVARYGKAFEMKVRYFDPFVDEPEVDNLERVSSLEELVSKSDVISLHTHLPEGDGHMIDAEMLSKFKTGSYLINTARGPLIDEQALIEALKNGPLAGAGIDVHPLEFEKGFFDNLNDDPLIQYAKEHDNLVLAPHIGGCSVDAWRITQEHVIGMMIDAFESRK